jgi:hypothetical protein
MFAVGGEILKASLFVKRLDLNFAIELVPVDLYQRNRVLLAV